MESLMNFDRVTNLMTHLVHANAQCLWQATPPLISVISPLFVVLNGDIVTTTTLKKNCESSLFRNVNDLDKHMPLYMPAYLRLQALIQ